MGLLDLRIQTTQLNAGLRGARVTNVYDAHNGRTYILKLSVPPPRTHHEIGSKSENPSHAPSAKTHASWEKRLLLIESGVRVHMTHYDREKDVPSGFCLKLRKHIRTRRLESVGLLGNGGDRIIDLVFSAEGATTAHLIIEAFSGGNVILTDASYTILTLLRTYRITAAEKAPATVAVRERYPVENARAYNRLDLQTFLSGVERARAAIPSASDIANTTGRAARRKLYARGIARKALAIELALEPSLLVHALIAAGFAADATVEQLFEHDSAGSRSVYNALMDIESQLEKVTESGEMKGYIISKQVKSPDGSSDQYDEFSPFLFAQYRQRSWKEYPTFDEAADEFFARLETERTKSAQTKREAAAFKKVDKLELELNGQVTAFENARDKSWEMAQAIESNITEVEAAITVIRSAIAAAVPWNGLARMVQDEKRNGNPVAEIIHSLQLESNQMTLMLEDTFGFDDDNDGDLDDTEDRADEDDSDDGDEGDDGSDPDNGREVQVNNPKAKTRMFHSSPESRTALLVPVDIDLTAHANARRHYEQRKNAAAKMEKAVEVKDRTIKAASKKAESEAQKLEEEAVAASIRATRKAFWFEKFYWFVSSENYLVVAGRDAQQNDLLVKRYMGPGDVYVHADVEGASSVIVKNRKRGASMKYFDLPKVTLDQAGLFAMCRSAAWDSKIITSAWWVRSTQVAKTTTSGVYLPAGNFAIRGKKNFLNPTQLVMGLGLLFKVDESCADRHKDERVIRGLDDVDEEKAFIQTEKTVSVNLHNACGPKLDNPKISLPDSVSTLANGKDNFASTLVQSIDADSNHSDAVQKLDALSIHATASSTVCPEPEVEESVVHKGDKSSGRKSTSQLQGGKKRMSAKERKSVKKSRNAGDIAQSMDGNDEGNECVAEDDGERTNGKGNVKGKSGGTLPRGKKHKLKKMKKYEDQDEEERKIALAVLGSKPIKQEDDCEDDLSKCDGMKNDDINKNETAGPETSDGRNERFRNARQHEGRQEDLRLLDEEGLIELAKLEEETTAALRVLTATPTEEDDVQFALAVCAPYNALTGYRYRVKLMPGNLKRGKAYRAALVLFQRQAEKDLSKFKLERDALRLSSESDGIAGMLANVRILSPGLADAQKALAKAKKTASKKSSSSKKGKK